MNVRVLIGSKKGAFILESDSKRRDWRVRGPLCHALAELGIALSLGQKIAARARIARTPGFAAVLSVKHADRGDADP